MAGSLILKYKCCLVGDVNESCTLSSGHECAHLLNLHKKIRNVVIGGGIWVLWISYVLIAWLFIPVYLLTGKGNLSGLPKAPKPEHHINHSNIFNICSEFCIFVALALILARCRFCNIRGLAQSAGLDVHACLKTRFIVQQLKPSRWLGISEIPPRPRASRRCHCEATGEVCDGEQKEARSLVA